MIRHILLDLDLTLYPPSTGLMDEMNRRIEKYVEEFLHKTPEEASVLRRDFRDRHGSTLRGLFVEHGADPQRYLDVIHAELPGTHLSPDPDLRNALSSLPHPVYVFTNAPESYARRALEALGVSSEVRRVFDIAFTEYVGKPDLSAYQAVEKELHAAPEECLLLDDSLTNVEGARKAGWSALWLSRGAGVPGVESIGSVSGLQEYLAARRIAAAS